jgi:hypothetical protein
MTSQLLHSEFPYTVQYMRKILFAFLPVKRLYFWPPSPVPQYFFPLVCILYLAVSNLYLSQYLLLLSLRLSVCLSSSRPVINKEGIIERAEQILTFSPGFSATNYRLASSQGPSSLSSLPCSQIHI